MSTLEDLRKQLAEAEARHAWAMRAFVTEAGGVHAAAELLDRPPRDVARIAGARPLAMVIYRSLGAGGVDVDGRRYGETGGDDAEQGLADGRWYHVHRSVRPRIVLLIIVLGGVVTRAWPVLPGAAWVRSEAGTKVGLPLEPHPLTAGKLRELYPDLGLDLGDDRPMRQGVLREYLPVDGLDG